MKTKAFIAFSLTMVIAFCFGLAVGKIFSKHKQTTIINNVSEATLTDWEIMELAIYKTESGFNTLAVGKSDDFGLAQITPIYVAEVNRILGEDRYIHEDAFSPEKTHQMFTITQNYHNPTHDIDRAIASHNPTASSVYSVKVRKAMESIKQYEELRKLIRQ